MNHHPDRDEFKDRALHHVLNTALDAEAEADQDATDAATIAAELVVIIGGPTPRHIAEDASGDRIACLRRAFLVRAVRYLVAEAGIRQFLDIGTGLLTANSTHEVAQRLAPECRIFYADNDPLVPVHAQALLAGSPEGVTYIGSPEGVTDYIEADVRDPEAIVQRAAYILDFGRPIALMMLGILGQLSDADKPQAILQHLLTVLPPGSYLALSDGTTTNQRLNQTIANADPASSYHLRSPQQIAGFFTGLDLIDPGVVTINRWRPDLTGAGPGVTTIGTSTTDVEVICGIGRKPN